MILSLNDLPTLTLQLPPRVENIILFHPTTCQPTKTFILEATPNTELTFIKQQAANFFNIQTEFFDLIVRTHRNIDVLITEHNYDLLRQNYHVHKLLRVKQYSPIDFIFIQQSTDRLEYETLAPESAKNEKQQIALIPIQCQQNSDHFGSFFAEDFSQIRPVLEDWGLHLSPETLPGVHEEMADALLASLSHSITQTLPQFMTDKRLKPFHCSF